MKNFTRWHYPRDGCGRSYKNKYNLSKHMRNECGVEPQFKCEMYSKTYKRKDRLKLHYAMFHKIIYL